MEREGKRLKSVDLVKGIGICVVALFHIIDSTQSESLLTFSGIMMRLFGAVLGVFFFLSGYFYKPRKGYLYNLKHRVKTLLMPTIKYILIVSLMTFIFEWIFVGFPDILQYLKNIASRLYDCTSFLKYGEYGSDESYIFITLLPLWFMVRLFFVDLIFFAVADFAIKKVINSIITIVSLLTVTTIYYCIFDRHFLFQLNSCFALSALMIAGALFKKYDIIYKIEFAYKSIKYWVVLAIFVALFVLMFFFFSDYEGASLFNGSFGRGKTDSIETIYLWFICQIIAVYVVLSICGWLVKIPYIFKPLLYCGSCSATILAYHVVIAWLIVKCFNPNNELNVVYNMVSSKVRDTNTLIQLVAYIISITICCLINYLPNLLKKKIKKREAKNENNI